MKVSKTQILNELWFRGELRWLLYKHQLPIYNKIREVLNSNDPDMNSYVIDCSRQFGKSFIMFLIAVEDCLRYKQFTAVYVGPLKSQVNEIINGKTFGTIFKTCPQHLIPVHKDSTLVFNNNSRIRLAGTDNKNYENLRGGSANIILLDEAGFMADLEEGVLFTVEPMTKTTGGKVIYSSTPPESLDHDYYEVLRYHTEAGLISTYTIWDDKSLSEVQLQKIISQCKGQDTTKFKREYECQRIADTSRQVIPNFTQERKQQAILKDFVRDQYYPYWKKYIVADWGGRDRTAILFAHYNYRKKQVIIEDHLDLSGDQMTPGIISSKIGEKTTLLWGENARATTEIYYYCDNNNPLIQQDMNNTYRIPFVATSKGRLEGMVEKVKDWEYNDRIAYLPEAEFVANSVASAHWNKQKDMFARSKIYGHYDAAAALVYLVRNVDEHTDPVPVLHNVDPYRTFIMPSEKKLAETRGLISVFGNKGLR